MVTDFLERLHKKEATVAQSSTNTATGLVEIDEGQLQTDTQHAKCKWRDIKVGKEKSNLKDD